MLREYRQLEATVQALQARYNEETAILASLRGGDEGETSQKKQVFDQWMIQAQALKEALTERNLEMDRLVKRENAGKEV